MVDRLQAVLFDLDDTLLFSNVGEEMEEGFVKHYIGLLTEYARPLVDGQRLVSALLTASKAMVAKTDPQMTNEQAFWHVFAPLIGRPVDELRSFFAHFYEQEFPKLRIHTRPHPDARRAVQVCLDAGYRVVLATNPLFPRRAIEHRIEWAGVGDLPFELITAYENMHTSKPAPAYYAEVAALLDLDPAACLMVGNDVQRDIEPAQRAGMRTFLVDQWLNGDDTAVRPDGRGKLSDFITWITQTT